MLEEPLRPTNPDLFEGLKSALGEQAVSVSGAERHLHSQDESTYPAVVPDLVVWPQSTDDVVRIVTLAAEYGEPITGWGAASSSEGHAIPVRHGIVVDFARMNRILAVHAEDFQATVQPGVLRLGLEKHLSQYGLFFAPDPGANASVGGMIANNAAGIRAHKYGATRSNVLALEVVLANGDVIKTGSRSVKQSSGYDLTRLMIGSEGTLGLVTEATLKLHPVPQHFATAVVGFGTVAGAAQAAYGIIGAGLAPAALEILHQNHILYMNEDDGSDWPVLPSLMIEFTGSSDVATSDALDEARLICEDAGAESFTSGLGHQDRSEMWTMRHGARYRYRRRAPGYVWSAIDVSVPISHMPQIIAYAEHCATALGLPGEVLGHAGDGNIHMGIGYNPGDADEKRRAGELSQLIIEKALELEGTASGEHGIGLGKRKYMVAEHGAPAVEAMRAIKKALDPQNLLNPDKVLP
ncbi:MAG: FAD-binding protein [Acidimicrobiia bacterium]|nr:FAD-binding protein [Acidimicrobiia bacterium]